MAKGYSKDLRERAVLMVEGGESRREHPVTTALRRNEDTVHLGGYDAERILFRGYIWT